MTWSARAIAVEDNGQQGCDAKAAKEAEGAEAEADVDVDVDVDDGDEKSRLSALPLVLVVGSGDDGATKGRRPSGTVFAERMIFLATSEKLP